MRAPEKQKDRLQIPLMFAFRDAHLKRDADKEEDHRVLGERVVSERSAIRRRGADEALLKRDLAEDLGNLVDTIDLDSAIDLTDRPYVRKSVLNFGLYDLTHVVIDTGAADEVIGNLKRAILQHEPRLSPETLVIEAAPIDKHGDVNQRIKFKVRAELICKPLDIPIEFVAELDNTSGKVIVSKPAGAA